MSDLACTVAESAALLNVSEWQVYRLVEAGHLQKIPNLGRRVVIARRELERFASQGVAA